MANTPRLFLMDRRRKGSTACTHGNLRAVSTPEMQHFLFPFSTNGVHLHHQCRNTQQLGQGFIHDFLELFPTDSLHGFGGILDKGDDVGQQFHGKTSYEFFPHSFILIEHRSPAQKSPIAR
jgi:hypothetical protein